MKLNNDTYFNSEAMRKYWSVSQFKAFDKCEACALAEVNGDYQREETDALLMGSYIDAHYSNELPEFIERSGHKILNKRTGELKSTFKHAETIMDRIDSSELMQEYLEGDKQTILTANLFDVDWKIKMDIYNPDKNRIVDMKIVKDFEDIWDDKDGYKKDWINYWGYDIQGAIYQKVEQIATGRKEPLPYYLLAATKEKTPDIAIVQIPQYVLDMALKIVEAKIDRFDLIKQGLVGPIRCEHCDYCKSTKVLSKPSIYTPKEGAVND